MSEGLGYRRNGEGGQIYHEIGSFAYRERMRKDEFSMLDFGSMDGLKDEGRNAPSEVAQRIAQELGLESERFLSSNTLYLTSEVHLSAGEHGWVFFTLPSSKIEYFIHRPAQGGMGIVEEATPEALAKAEREYAEVQRERDQRQARIVAARQEDEEAKKLPVEEQIRRLKELGREKEAQFLQAKIAREAESREDEGARELPIQKQIERLVKLGRDNEASSLAAIHDQRLDYHIAVKRRDAKKKQD